MIAVFYLPMYPFAGCHVKLNPPLYPKTWRETLYTEKFILLEEWCAISKSDSNHVFSRLTLNSSVAGAAWP